MLATAGMVFFVTPSMEEAQAQSGTVRNFCFNASSRTFPQPSSAGTCPSGSTQVSAPAKDGGFCVFKDNDTGTYVAESPTESGLRPNAAGTACEDSNGVLVVGSKFVTFKTITDAYPVPPGTPTTPTTPTTPGNTNPPVVRGDCDEGFHKSGPLCIPDSKFSNNNAIVGERTVGGLAARIVQILLYFAGIVAVIMAIIGGYQIMTAAGNETRATNGRKTLINAIIGLVIVILSYVIISAVINFVTT